MILLRDLGQLKPTEKSLRTYRYGLYMCPSCENEYKIQTRYMNKHKDICKICSAKERKNNLKHNGSGTRLYNIWKGIKARCYNKNVKIYKWYGEKGVIMCDEWKNDFQEFEKWALENGYAENKVIDKDFLSNKLNIDKIYSPETCQWISKIENTNIRNKRK